MPLLPEAGPRRAALHAALRRSIETGLLAPGAKLPPTRELAARFRLARGAAVAAYETLVAEGYAVARVGAGTFVAAAVPRLDPPPISAAASTSTSASASTPTPERMILPGTLGAVSPDPRTEAIFRSLLRRHLAAPAAGPRGYSDPRGGRELREAIADYLRAARGLRCSADDVVVTSGAQHGLDLAVRALLAPGDAAWIEDPCYPAALAALRGAGLDVVGVPVDGEGLDPAVGLDAAPQARAVYVTPSHQFPMGVVLSMRRRLALIDWAKRAGSWIFEDDYDSEFRYAGAPLTALQGIDDGGRVVYLGTFSKALHPGLRVGYMVLPPAAMAAVLTLRERSDRFPPTLAEGALADLVRDGHFAAHLRRGRRRARAQRDALVEALAAIGLVAVPPDHGLHLIAGLDAVDDTALAPALTEAGLGARALARFHVARPLRRGLVIGFSGFTPEALAAAVRPLAPLVARHRL